ncbi:hypothetical protein CYMTET_20913 [Cymbomonas tetramitiformis]|uniref:F-box/LRR-repeat protein 15-like leucin rich repeat domain-containing protein n=1 Tax=Cymbomonas tetramitiformis TaxID=36881 RepID=A0AAE0G355_9CHLO|nr:hypothetical protein CYMTET_20913 [Cymbomonas tetramitiformis]
MLQNPRSIFTDVAMITHIDMHTKFTASKFKVNILASLPLYFSHHLLPAVRMSKRPRTDSPLAEPSRLTVGEPHISLPQPQTAPRLNLHHLPIGVGVIILEELGLPKLLILCCVSRALCEWTRECLPQLMTLRCVETRGGDTIAEARLRECLERHRMTRVRRIELHVGTADLPAAAPFLGTLVFPLCPRLQHLDVHGCQGIREASINALAENCPLLQHLDVHGCVGVKDASLPAVAKGCPRLQELFADYCPGVTDVSIRAVAEGCPDLRRLGVGGCEGVTDASVRAVAERCPELRQLGVGGCEGVTDVSIRAVAEHCSHLQYLDIACCRRVTDMSVQVVAECCPDLRELDAFGCGEVTDASIQYLGELCPELQYLDVHGCRRVTCKSIRIVGEHCRKLRYLDVHDCVGVTDDAVQELGKHCAKLQHLCLVAILRGCSTWMWGAVGASQTHPSE